MHFPSPIPPLFVLLFIPAVLVSAQQINLGSFTLQRSPFTGDIQLGIGQNGQILGFGGDRHFGLNLGPGRLGARSDNGLLLGGHRFGLDSLLGYQEGRGFDFGNFLNLFQPVHQLLNGGGIRPPPPPSPTWPNPQAAQIPVQNPIEPIQMPPPTLIPPPASNWAGNGQQQTNIGQEQFPPSFGEGWKSEEEMNSFERTEDGLEEGQRELMPWSAIKSANGQKGGNWRGQGRITTEGRFRNGGEIGKNDGETKKVEEFVKGKTSNGLPVPNGLEPLKI